MIWVFLLLFSLISPAHAQCNGVFPSNSVCGNTAGSPAPPGPIQIGTVLPPSNASASQQTTTGTISSSTSALALNSAIDFKNGQGIMIIGAGATFTGAAPTGFTVTPTGGTGSTHYSYSISCVDANGGYGAAVTATTTTGSASLTGVGGTYNHLAWTGGAGCSGYLVYNNGTGLLGSTTNTTFDDFNQFPVQNVAPWINSSAPVSAQNDWLLTTITAGGSTTSLTLAGTATNSVSSASVVHDDSTAINAALTTGAGVNLGNKTYNVAKTINLGNGGHNVTSTVNNVILTGSAPPDNSLNLSFNLTGPTLSWIGNISTPVVSINGVMYGAWVRSLNIDCNQTGAMGLKIISGQYGEYQNLGVFYCNSGIYSTTVGNSATFNDAIHNNFQNIVVAPAQDDTATCISLTGDPTTTDSDGDVFQNITCNDKYGQPGKLIGLYLGYTDSNQFFVFHALGVSTLVEFDYTVLSGFPGSQIFYGLDTSQGPLVNVGSPAAIGAQSAQVLNPLNGTLFISCPTPLVPNVVCTGGPGFLPGPYTIATLPTCNNTNSIGWETFITNGVSSPTYGATVSTTGSTTVPVFCDGTNWRYH